jgi:succinate dehydrogenase/fumarate reductase flavoprotein subunit
METGVPGLYAAGEAVAGANGANRLSGNAITEALVFGQRAGEAAARHAKAIKSHAPAPLPGAASVIAPDSRADAPNLAAMMLSLQQLMNDKVGPFRTGDKLSQAQSALAAMQQQLGERPFGHGGGWDAQRMDWYDLRAMLISAQAVTTAALAREESRGAHQREDFPGMLEPWTVNQVMRLHGDQLQLRRVAVAEAA